jgi:hypothetical protein
MICCSPGAGDPSGFVWAEGNAGLTGCKEGFDCLFSCALDIQGRQNVCACAEYVQSKATGTSKAPLASSNVANTAAQKDRSVEEIYQKKTPLEHILLRPDTYVGSTEKQQMALWVHDGERMVQQNVGIVPGLYKIFDEILVNAADNKVRDPNMNAVRVNIDVVSGTGTPAPVGRLTCQHRWPTTCRNRAVPIG